MIYTTNKFLMLFYHIGFLTYAKTSYSILLGNEISNLYESEENIKKFEMPDYILRS